LVIFTAVVLFAELLGAFVSTHFRIKSFRTECIKRGLLMKAATFVTMCIMYLYISMY
jgi:hypothetical protein